MRIEPITERIHLKCTHFHSDHIENSQHNDYISRMMNFDLSMSDSQTFSQEIGPVHNPFGRWAFLHH